MQTKFLYVQLHVLAMCSYNSEEAVVKIIKYTYLFIDISKLMLIKMLHCC